MGAKVVISDRFLISKFLKGLTHCALALTHYMGDHVGWDRDVMEGWRNEGTNKTIQNSTTITYIKYGVQQQSDILYMGWSVKQGPKCGLSLRRVDHPNGFADWIFCQNFNFFQRGKLIYFRQIHLWLSSEIKFQRTGGHAWATLFSAAIWINFDLDKNCCDKNWCDKNCCDKNCAKANLYVTTTIELLGSVPNSVECDICLVNQVLPKIVKCIFYIA